MGILERIILQTRRPAGRLGHLTARVMNYGHRGLISWALSMIEIGDDFVILDVGCGGGGTIARLSGRARSGTVYGIDHSATSVKVSRRRNRRLIAEGRVVIVESGVSSIPYPDAMFDLVTAIESHIFWPDLVSDLTEVRRVTKPGGRVLVTSGVYRNERFARRNGRLVRLLDLNYQNPDELDATLRAAGFSDVEVIERRGKGWLCGMGRA